MKTEDEILAELVGILVEVVGEDFLMEGEVGPYTTFNDDLALESIEFVALAEKLQRHYGGQVDFAAFVSGMGLEQILALSVGDLVTYIGSRLRAGKPQTDSPLAG